MMSAWHLFWIVPLAAAIGFFAEVLCITLGAGESDGTDADSWACNGDCRPCGAGVDQNEGGMRNAEL